MQRSLHNELKTITIQIIRFIAAKMSGVIEYYKLYWQDDTTNAQYMDTIRVIQLIIGYTM